VLWTLQTLARAFGMSFSPFFFFQDCRAICARISDVSYARRQVQNDCTASLFSIRRALMVPLCG